MPDHGRPITDVIKAILNCLVNWEIVWFIVSTLRFEEDNSPIPKLIPKRVYVRAIVDIKFDNWQPVSNQNFFSPCLVLHIFKMQTIEKSVKNKMIDRNV